MNTDTIKGKWTQMIGHIKSKWWDLTDDDLKKIDGNKDILVGKLQEKYWYTKQEAESEVNRFTATYGSEYFTDRI